ncbi:MAG: hypothetical protein QXU32_07540 [Nitrososphaerales archaeon]
MKKIANEPKLNSNSAYTSIDEDCPQIETRERSDTWEMRTEKLYQVTTAKQKTKREGKIKRLLANIEVKRWYDNLARGSEITAYNRLKTLSRFCDIHQMTPMQIIELGMKDIRSLTNLLEDHVTWMEEKHYAPGHTEQVVKTVRSWLRHFEIEIKRRIKVKNSDSTPTLEEERVPEAAEMAEIFSRASLREGAAISLIAKAGLRPEVLGNNDGTDGLMMKDLPDIAIVQGVAKCLRTPPRIIVRKTLSKARHQYFTFLTSQGTKRLLAYLNDRLAHGEPLTANSPVIAPDKNYGTYRGNNGGKSFLPTQRICRKIRKTFRPRFQWRPYVLRAYFDTQLLIAESRGKIAHDFRVFFMGHKGTIEAKYTTNKGILPEALIDEMCEAFKRSEKFLDLELSEEDPLLKQKEQLHRKIEEATPEKVQEMLRLLGVCNT